MKCQILLSEKKKKSKCRLLKYLPSMLRSKVTGIKIERKLHIHMIKANKARSRRG